MNILKYKVFKRYKKAETYLKNHPFWPSFLSNGGILVLFLIGSVIFTITCGKNSVRDNLPELKVVDLRFDGDYHTWLDKIYVYHNLTLPALKEGQNDRLSVLYGSTDSFRCDSLQADLYDETQVFQKIDDYGLTIDKQNSIISKMKFKTYDTFSLIESHKNLIFEKEVRNSENVVLIDTIDTAERLLYVQDVICSKDQLKTTQFAESFDGNFISTNKRNPYIYLHFILDGDFLYHPEESNITFVFSEKDVQMSETKLPVNILSIFPEPTYQSPSFITYKGDDLRKVIENNGFTFLGEDLSIKQKSDRNTFLWTVLFGTAIALTIDILVNLILKWRDILPKRRRKL